MCDRGAWTQIQRENAKSQSDKEKKKRKDSKECGKKSQRSTKMISTSSNNRNVREADSTGSKRKQKSKRKSTPSKKKTNNKKLMTLKMASNSNKIDLWAAIDPSKKTNPASTKISWRKAEIFSSLRMTSDFIRNNKTEISS